MNEAIRQILAAYEIRSVEDSLRALREVMQEIALSASGEASSLKMLPSMAARRSGCFTGSTVSPRT